MSGEASRIRSMGTSHDARLIEVELQIGSRSHRVYFQSNDMILTENMEAFLALALLPSMKEGGALVAEGKASQRFLDALHTILDIYCSWDAGLRRVEIRDVVPVMRDGPKEHRVGTFFTGGVDSFYTFLKHRDEITDLIFVHGFDVSLENYSLRRRASEMIHKIGSSFGKRVIEVETNLRSFLDSYFRLSWGTLTFGIGLVSVGHLLSRSFKRIYIPGSHTYAGLFPWGSHPLLDPLWSTETLEFVHDGCEAKRIDKVALLSGYDIALQSLRVCFFNSKGAYNCGECEKCLRTMINLYVVGALNRCTTFETCLNIRRVSKLIVSDDSTRTFVKENLKALEERGGDLKLCKALRKILNRSRWKARAITKFLRLKGRLKRIVNKFLCIYQDHTWISHPSKGSTNRSRWGLFRSIP
jgi:hypothetical protein